MSLVLCFLNWAKFFMRWNLGGFVFLNLCKKFLYDQMFVMWVGHWRKLGWLRSCLGQRLDVVSFLDCLPLVRTTSTSSTILITKLNPLRGHILFVRCALLLLVRRKIINRCARNHLLIIVLYCPIFHKCFSFINNLRLSFFFNGFVEFRMRWFICLWLTLGFLDGYLIWCPWVKCCISCLFSCVVSCNEFVWYKCIE